jgi:hypothetical protein
VLQIVPIVELVFRDVGIFECRDKHAFGHGSLPPRLTRCWN